MTRRPAEETPKDPRPDVLAAIAALQKGHAVGRAVREQYKEHAPPGKMSELAKDYGYTLDALRKLRQFAATYTKEDLAELCKLCRDHQRALGLVFVYRLVAIKNKTRRRAFQRQAITEHWGHAQFARELRRRFTLGHRRGRTSHRPESIPEALAEIKEAKQRFIELLEHCRDKIAKTEGTRQEKQGLRDLARQLLAAIEGV